MPATLGKSNLNTKNESLWYLPGRYSYIKKHDFLVLFAEILLQVGNSSEHVRIGKIRGKFPCWQTDVGNKRYFAFRGRQLLVEQLAYMYLSFLTVM